MLDINLIGVLYNTFLPHIRVHGEGGDMASTAPLDHPSGWAIASTAFALLRAA